MTDNYSLLIKKLDEFIRKHYINQLLRGLIYSSALILGAFLLLNVIEYYFYLPVWGRKVLFFGFIAGGLGVLFWWVGLPLLHYYRLGKIISHEQAARIIGTHFQNVQDRLLNILQLKRQSESAQDKTLIEASINQKIESIKLVPFTAAIDLKSNRKYLRYLVVPLLALILIFFSAPNILKEGTTRLIHVNRHYEKPAPFRFVVKNPSLRVIQFEDFTLEAEVTGEVLPDNLFIKVEGHAYKMEKLAAGTYRYKFVNLQQSQDFVLSAAGYDSKIHTIEVLPKPMVVNFEVYLDYPAYTGRRDEVLKNIGDLNVPLGTKARWELHTNNTDKLTFRFTDEELAERSGKDLFILNRTLQQSGYYTITISNSYIERADSISYTLTVIPDQYPALSVQPVQDSATLRYLYFTGEASDDYGLTRLELKYKIIRDNDIDTAVYHAVPVPFKKGLISQFTHFWDLQPLGLKPGEAITYFFEVWDNDGIHGSKSTRSSILQFKMPTLEQLEEETRLTNENIKSDLDKSVSKAGQIRSEIQKAQEKLLQKKNLTWEDKKEISELIKQQQTLEETIRQLQEKFSNNLSRQQEYKQISEEIRLKQQKLQELFNEVLSPEMKEMFEKLQSLMEQLDLGQMMENLKEFELSQEQLSQELDRMLELFKKLEFEQKLAETTDKLQQLADKQEQLSEETKNASRPNDQLLEEQQKLNSEFDNLQQTLGELQKMSQELGQNEDFNETRQQADQTRQEMQKGSENIKQNKNKKASENQKNAAQKMRQMSETLAQMMGNMQMEQLEMDMRAIRQLLDNLLTLSFDQEELIRLVNETSINDPKYVDLAKMQQKIKDETALVRDSLYALSKRVFQLQTFINREMTDVYKNIEKSIVHLADRKKSDAALHQQYVMTGFNNLALMLDESLQQMQQQMAAGMSGTQMCQKKGQGTPTPKLGQMQQQLNEQMSKLQEELKKGKQPGGKGGMSKEIAEMAAKQAAIREALRKLNQEENTDGSLGNLDKLMDEMNKTETELYNKQLTEQMLMRQQEILTRLLEVEKSMREREQDEKRQAETADEIARQMPPSLEEYLRQREAEIQLYKTVPPKLKPYYRQLIESYFKNITF
ncbi:MAG: ATPase [Chitinophagales bacterium]|nr:MAG: ATPase [Chitinophagales bacterium]